jgi:hypothetical protein
MVSTTALAVITSFTVNPNPPVIGGGFAGTAKDDGKDVINSYKWQYQFVGPQGPLGQCKTALATWDQGQLSNLS